MIDKQPVRYKQNPVLLDRVLDDMRRELLVRLPWLNYTFGRVYKLMKYTNDGKYTEPAFYVGRGEYVSMLPNDNWGNFCWFDIYDPQSIDTTQRSNPKLTFRGAIVFWFDQTTVTDSLGNYYDDDFLCTEEVKKQVVEALSTSGLLKQNGHVQIFDIYERLENLYKGYSLEKVYNTYLYSGEELEYIDKQYFMYPYGGLRIELELTINSADC